MTDELLISDEGRARVLTFNRPERLGAVTEQSYRLLAAALDEADADEGVHVVLLRGSGPGYCSGVDLKELRATDPRAITEAFRGVIGALAGFRKPLVAAVHGVAVGFGVTMLLHCDLVIVTEDARFRTPFAQLGTSPEAASSWLLPRRIGPQRAADLLLTGRWIGATEAVQIGLAARCCSADEFEDHLADLLRDLTDSPLPALVAAKQLLRGNDAEEIRAAVERELAAAEGLLTLLGPLGSARALPR